MSEWKKEMIETNRGCFEVFVKGEGAPVCVTHHYSEFNESGDYFAETFIETNKVFLVNLKDAGNTDKAENAYELSMVDAVLDLEEIRKVFGYLSWTFAGHSTGGMIGVLYGIHFSSSLKSLIIVGSSAREYSSTSSKCIYNEGHPNYKRMQEVMELLKLPSLTEDERYRLSKERVQLSLFEPENFEHYFSKNISKNLSANRSDHTVLFLQQVLLYLVLYLYTWDFYSP